MEKQKLTIGWLGSILLFVVFVVEVIGTVPSQISFQGRLNDATGTPVADGVYAMRFYLFDNATGGNQLWNSPNGEEQNVTVTEGIYAVQLGQVQPISASALNGGTAWLEVVIRNASSVWETLSPRLPITSTGYALKAGDADTVGGQTLAGLDSLYVNTGESAAVTSAMIVDNSISTADLANSAVSTAKIADLTVAGTKLAANSVTAAKIDSGAVGSAAIADGSITAADLAEDYVKTAGDSMTGDLVVTGDITASNGIYGSNTSSYGVSGSSASSHGVYGVNTGATSNIAGVYGRANSTTGTTYGVMGSCAGNTSYGVYGTHSTSNNYGYLGTNTFGAYGYNYSSHNYGGLGGATAGVVGYGTTGVSATNSGTSANTAYLATSSYAGDFSSDVRVKGDILREYVAGAPKSAVPVAYGTVNSNSTISSGSGNFTVIWDGLNSWYEITITGESYLYLSYTTVANTIGGTVPRFATTSSVSGRLIVAIHDLSGDRQQNMFGFVVYRP